MATSVPTPGNDLVFATRDGEIIDGLAGNDVLGTAFPNTTLIGSVGNDWLSENVKLTLAGTVASELRGGSGNDTLWGDFSFVLSGGAGSESVSMDGGDGNDRITAALHVDTSGGGEFSIDRGFQIEGGAGNDIVLLTASLGTEDENFSVFGDDREASGAGNDIIITRLDGRGMQQDLDGGAGNDYIFSSIAADGFLGNAYGGSGNDVVAVKVTLRTADSFAGVRLEGEDGNDCLTAEVTGTEGGNGFVGMFGGAGRDLLVADISDRLGGVAGLVGGAGDDKLCVSGGGLDPESPNIVDGGAGSDQMTGSQNADVFIFRAFTEDGDAAELADSRRDRDVVSNFQPGLDKIALPDGAEDVTAWKTVHGQGLLLTIDGDGDQLLLRNVCSYNEIENDFILVA